MSDIEPGDTAPERPDAGLPAHPAPPPPARARISRAAMVMIVFACIVAVAGMALVIVLAVNSVGNGAEDQFKQIQYCIDHPHAQECNPPGFSP